MKPGPPGCCAIRHSNRRVGDNERVGEDAESSDVALCARRADQERHTVPRNPPRPGPRYWSSRRTTPASAVEGDTPRTRSHEGLVVATYNVFLVEVDDRAEGTRPERRDATAR